ncbi:MAG: hypothetical protein CVU56_22860 [Deltaproteobacteria bacterium HGW-Deltaproteobacteria-14]|nr:MAG: hypothetical protein CVU56_22860 [Deltaproteobacteria bacterium HGW-Deltaproteobacteria-14]
MTGLATVVMVMTALTAGSGSGDLGETLARGWSAVTAGQYAEAEAAYVEATGLAPRSEDAWLGLQLARLSRGDWPGAAEAGARALALNPDSYWARSRQAWVKWNQRDLPAAREHYEAALVLAPGDPEMVLGLGFTLAGLGDEAGARARCDEAARALGEDPRIAACRAAADALGGGPIAGAALSATWLGNVRGSVERVASGSVVASVRWPAATLWAGVTASDALGIGQVGETLGAAHVGVELRLGSFTGALAGALLRSSNADTDGGGLASGRLAFMAGAWTLGIGGGLALLPSVSAGQVDPFVSVRAGAVTLTVGPELAVVDGEQLVSGHLRVDWAVSGRVGLWVGGYYGDRQNPVDADGLAFWTGADRFLGGWQVGLRWAATDWLALSLAWRYDVVRVDRGDGNGSGSADALYGGTLGVGFDF